VFTSKTADFQHPTPPAFLPRWYCS